jgi:hypothetical protein
MMDGDLFDKLEQVACKLRKNEKPFGGMQACAYWGYLSQGHLPLDT